MNGSDVLGVLLSKGITRLHHANTIATSRTFFELGGLASRGFVADRGLDQTPQYSDAQDQEYGIWQDIFLDSADIHDRARSANQYGPLLFVFESDALGRLPPGAEVAVARKNPVHWVQKDEMNDRYFLTLADLEAGLQLGTFGQHIMVRDTALLPFADGLTQIILDDPIRELSPKTDAFTYGLERLEAANQTALAITKRKCRDACKCLGEYGALPDFRTPNFEQRFR